MRCPPLWLAVASASDRDLAAPNSPSTPPLEALARFRHAPYIDMLPAPSALRTPLYFTDAELNAFRGTALHGATLDRRAAGEVEWQNCVDAFHAHLVDGLATRFTWCAASPTPQLRTGADEP